MIDFAITVKHEISLPRQQELVTLGVPFARSVLKDASQLIVVDADGKRVPSQSRSQCTWGDGSVRWALIHFLGDLGAGGTTPFRVKLGDGSTNGVDASVAPIKLSREPARVRVDTGKLQFSIDGGTFRGLEHVRILTRDGKTWVNAAQNAPGGSLYLIDAAGVTHTAQKGRVTLFEIEEAGPLVCTIHVEGEMADVGGKEKGEGIVEYDLWIQAVAGSPTVRCFLTIRNPRATIRQLLGTWPLGSEGSIYFQEAGWQVQPNNQGVPYVTLHGGNMDYIGLEDEGAACIGVTAVPAAELKGEGPSEIYRGPFTQEAKVVQDSSGGERWFNRNHINRNWKLSVNYKGWKSFVDGKEGPSGDRASAWVACEDPRIGLAIGMRHFWQNFPKAVRAVKQADGKPLVQLCFWPKEVADANGGGLEGAHELQGGEQKTHEFVLHFFRGDSSRVNAGATPYACWPETAMAMCRAIKPPRAIADFKQYAASRAFDYIAPYDKEAAPRYETVNEGSLLAKPVNLLSQIEAFDEFGWRNFGDVIADGEISGRILSHYNLEYDMGWAMLFQTVRTEGKRPDLSNMWWDLAEPALRHEADMDVYHTSKDAHNRGTYNHGKHHHTDHAYEAGRSTHRAYEEDGMQGDYDYHEIRGGGPESAHMNNRGMFTYAMMSGYPAALKVTTLMADLIVYKIRNDVGAQIKEFSRDTGHNMQILLSAYQLTGDKKYLDTARHAVDVTHPDRHPWRKGFPVRETVEEYPNKSLGMWVGAIFMKEVARVAEIVEEEKLGSAAREITCLLQGVEVYNQYGWDDSIGRYAHGLSPEGKHFRYREPWWDLRIIDLVAWSCRWQKDAATRSLWMSRCRRNFDEAVKLLAPDVKHLPFYQSKCSTVAGQAGPGFLVLEKMIDWKSVPTAGAPVGSMAPAK